MALGWSPQQEEEQDVAGPLPVNPANLAPPLPTMPAPAQPGGTVMTPLGQLPPSALPPGQQPPPDAPAGPPPGAPPTTAAGPADSSPASTLPPPPAPPQSTGDPAKDIEQNQTYGRALNDWHTQVTRSLSQTQNDVHAKQAADELKIAQDAEARRQAEQQAKEADLAQRRQAITAATDERAHAIGDLESGKYKEQSTGTKIASTIALALGTIGAGFSAAGGHPTGNMAAQAIDNMLDREYNHAQERVKNANASILEARYGYKDAEDNHRAELNNIDADMAAKYKLVAKEAESQLLAKGASPEQVAQNELVFSSLQKAHAYEDQIHAREIEAQRKAEDEQRKHALDTSTIRKNNAEADSAEARANRLNRAGKVGAGGGLSKAGLKAQSDEIKAVEHVADKEQSILEGSARSKGAIEGYRAANAVVNELKKAAAKGDPDSMKIAVMHAQEQSTRFLTGAAPTQQTFEIQHALASTPEQLEAKFGGWIGQPTEAKSYVMRMAKNIQAIADQQHEVVEQHAGPLVDRFKSIVKTDEGKRRAQGILDQLFGKGAYSLDGKVGGKSSEPRKTQKIGGVEYEFGDDGNWHKAK